MEKGAGGGGVWMCGKREILCIWREHSAVLRGKFRTNTGKYGREDRSDIK